MSTHYQRMVMRGEGQRQKKPESAGRVIYPPALRADVPQSPMRFFKVEQPQQLELWLDEADEGAAG